MRQAPFREVGFIRKTPWGRLTLEAMVVVDSVYLAIALEGASDDPAREVAGTFTRDAADGALVIELASRSFGNDPRMLGSTRRIRVMAGQLTRERERSTTTAPPESYLPHLNARLQRTT